MEQLLKFVTQQKIIATLQAEKAELLKQLSKAHSDIIEISMKKNIMNQTTDTTIANNNASKLQPEKKIDISDL